MRLLVLSDAHGDEWAIARAIQSQPTAEAVLFLGDGAADFERAAQGDRRRRFAAVRGNCDWGSLLPDVDFFFAGGKKLLLTHGHTFQVKWSLGPLLSAARSHRADVVLFGHTHAAMTGYEDGVYLLNPGTVGGVGAPPTLGIVDITPAGIVPSVIRLS